MADIRIVIVGAGIAGLALGRALLCRGFNVEIIERANTWQVAGAGLYMPGNGVRAIAALGLGDALAAHAVPISHQRLLDHRGRLLAEVELPRVWGHVGPCIGIRRIDLHRILLDGATGVPIRMGRTIRAVTQTRQQVSLQFDDGVTRSYDVLVGADGINSSIRRKVFGDIRPQWTGLAAWRFIAPDACGVTCWTAFLGPGRTFLMMPVGDGGLYCYADVIAGAAADAAGHDGAAESRHGLRERLRALVHDFGDPVPRVLAQLGRVDTIHAAPVEEIDMDRPVDGRVALIGDAAHASSPSMAQGASMALEDALILADELARHAPVEALAAFAARRRARVRWVRDRTHKRDRIRRWPGLVRNLALRAAGRRIYEADYRPLFDEP